MRIHERDRTESMDLAIRHANHSDRETPPSSQELVENAALVFDFIFKTVPPTAGYEARRSCLEQTLASVVYDTPYPTMAQVINRAKTFETYICGPIDPKIRKKNS